MDIGLVWFECFGLYTAEPPSDLDTTAANPLIDETPPSLAEVKEAVRKLQGGKVVGIYGTSEEMLKTGG